MADQEKNKNEDLENLDPILDEDTFSLDLDDFDLGDDDLDSTPGMEPPSLEDIEHNDAQLAATPLEEDEDGLGDLIVSSSDDSDDDFLDIDLDSDLNLLGEEDPILHDEDIHSDFENYDIEESSPSHKTPRDSLDDELELEFDDDIIDLDKEIDAILNGEDGILSQRNETATEEFGSDFNVNEEDDGPIALSMEELENIAGISEEEYEIEAEDDLGISSIPDEQEADDTLSDIDLDLDDSEIDTKLTFDEEGLPELDLEEEEESGGFKPIRDPEEEELFGSAKEDENLTLSDDELGNILGSNGEASLEETLGSDEDFAETESLPEFGEEEFSFDEETEKLEEESSLSEEEPSTNFAEDEDDDGPITLSLEELDNISEEAEEETALDILDDEPEDETITLSPDELGNILGNEESEEEEESSKDSDFDIDLGSDELPEMSFDLDSEEETSESSSGLEGEYEEAQNDILSEDLEDDDGPIALSMEELESIAGDAEEAPDEELVDSLDRAPLPYEEEPTTEEVFLEEDLEDESIALSMEELENITAGEEDAVETLSNESIDDLLGEVPGDNLDDIAELPDEEHVPSLDLTNDDDSEDDHEIELTLDPLDLNEEENLVSFEESDEDIAPVNGGLPPTLAEDLSKGIEIDLDEYALEGKLSPLEELRAEATPLESVSQQTKETVEVAGSELSIVERKKVLGYLDNLLGNLPDEVIQEFSKSDYFDLYKKLMKELEL
ncbi:hypothetical protein [Leptospira ilyithenensis]|uniref:Uncharacterized protein n=1 Tax=Leptospira ilyithenensis TaxID=2484901 RepID=A0A4R9LSZ9_9LEPT|nr:hypothetical protein [Leptospira ilyithenensis]TGN10554.1 hypothetical protein EHS11_09720 [Leptospira ilyithenensis]